LVLQRRRIGEELRPLRIPGGPAVPLAAMALVLALMTTLARNEVVALVLVTTGAAVSYWFSTGRSRRVGQG
jgi:positive regulator of sigma E activity